MGDQPDASARNMNRPPASLAAKLVRFGFQQLYTRCAWLYDDVANLVSLGEWQAWGRVTMQFLDTDRPAANPLRLLELAHGPGHLQLALRQRGYHALGIDISAQMGRLACQRLQRAGFPNTLARASVFALPFPSASFDALISTFPTEFIFAPPMLREAARVLPPAGRLIVLPGAPLHNSQAGERLIRLAYRFTRQAKPATTRIQQLFEQSGLAFTEHHVPARHAEVVIWLGVKRPADTPQIG
jgi:ubiquinone/menaquinone biosynthesis C-methylase UbiE